MNFLGGTDYPLQLDHAASTGSIQTSDSSSPWIENLCILHRHRRADRAEQANLPVRHNLAEVSPLNLFKIKAPVICALPSRVRGLTGGLLAAQNTTRTEPGQDTDETHARHPRNQRDPGRRRGQAATWPRDNARRVLTRATKPGPRL